MNHQQDPYGNWLSRFVFPEPVTELKIEVDLVADMTVYNPFDFFVEDLAEHWPFDYPEDLHDDLVIYRRPEPVGPRLQAFLDTIPRERARTVDFVVGLNARLSQRDRLRHPHGARRADARGDLRARHRLLPRHAPGCSSRPCATSASPPASSPAT